jgi:NAD(P)H-nitrite reductase large subunit
MKRFIVIGASAASISFITKLRTFDATSEIICFSGERYQPYNRCFLADVLSNEKTIKEIELKPESFYVENRIDLRLNSWVEFIEYDMKMVAIGSEMIEYDYLFLGVGSHAVHLPFYDEKIQGLFNFHTLDDIERIQAFIKLKPIQSAIVVGAGLNGLECSFALSKLGIKTVLVDGSDRPLAQQVDQRTSEEVLSLMQQGRVEFVGSSFVDRILVKDGAIAGVVSKDGKTILAEMVICAAGAQVQNELVQNSPLKLHRGSILVNAALQTNLPEIFAAGDVIFTDELIHKRKARSMTWSDAMLQGLSAATQFSSAPRPYAGLVGMRDSNFFGRAFYACGETVHVENYEIVEHQGKDFFHRLYLENGLVKGFVMLGNIDQLSVYRQYFLTQKVYE